MNIIKNIISEEPGLTTYEVVDLDTSQIIGYDYVSTEVNE